MNKNQTGIPGQRTRRPVGARAGWLAAFAVLMASNSAGAGGLYLYELGTRDAGFAGAGWAARADDASTLATNPAGLSRLTSGEFIVGLQPLYADIQFDPDANTTVAGDDGDAADWIPSGGVYYGRPLNERWAFGFGVYGNFGSTLDYGTNWVGRYYVDKVTLQALAIQPTLSYRINDEWSVGAGVVGLYGIFDQRFRIRNLTPGAGDAGAKIKDEQFEVTGNFGVLWEPSNGTRFGLQYLMEAKLGFSDDPSLKNVGPLLQQLLDNSGLAGGNLGLDLTYPNALMFSGYHELSERWAMTGNLGWQQWSEFGKVDVVLAAEDQTSLTFDRNYDDTWHAAVGAEYRRSDRWRFSGGIAYDSSAVDDDDRTPDLPIGETWRFGFGAEYSGFRRVTVAGTYALLWSGDLDMDVNRGPLSGRVSGSYNDTAVHAIGIIFTWRDL